MKQTISYSRHKTTGCVLILILNINSFSLNKQFLAFLPRGQISGASMHSHLNALGDMHEHLHRGNNILLHIKTCIYLWMQKRSDICRHDHMHVINSCAHMCKRCSSAGLYFYGNSFTHIHAHTQGFMQALQNTWCKVYRYMGCLETYTHRKNCMHVNTHINTWMHINPHMHTNQRVYMQTQVYVHMHTDVHTCTHEHNHTHEHTRTHEHNHTREHTHAYILQGTYLNRCMHRHVKISMHLIVQKCSNETQQLRSIPCQKATERQRC